MDTTKLYQIMKVIVAFMLVIALGMVAVNQSLGYFYKSKLLQTPCELCVSLNPEWEQCYNQIRNHVPDSNNYSLDTNIINYYINP